MNRAPSTAHVPPSPSALPSISKRLIDVTADAGLFRQNSRQASISDGTLISLGNSPVRAASECPSGDARKIVTKSCLTGVLTGGHRMHAAKSVAPGKWRKAIPTRATQVNKQRDDDYGTHFPCRAY